MKLSSCIAASMMVCLSWGCAESRNAVRPVAADTNWRTAREVSMVLEEYHFTPATVRLEVDQPYILKLENRGQEEHGIHSADFFDTAQSYKVVRGSDSDVTGEVDSFELNPGEKLEWYFIPARAGTFDFICDEDDHDARGMIGTIIVE